MITNTLLPIKSINLFLPISMCNDTGSVSGEDKHSEPQKKNREKCSIIELNTYVNKTL